MHLSTHHMGSGRLAGDAAAFESLMLMHEIHSSHRFTKVDWGGIVPLFWSAIIALSGVKDIYAFDMIISQTGLMKPKTC